MAKKEPKAEKPVKTKVTDVAKFDLTSHVKADVGIDNLSLLKCPGCGGVHFRHAGYVERVTSFAQVTPEHGAEFKGATNSEPVKVCVSCKRSFIDVNGAFREITSHIDLKAWAKTEKEANEATGPGGEC